MDEASTALLLLVLPCADHDGICFGKYISSSSSPMIGHAAGFISISCSSATIAHLIGREPEAYNPAV